MESFANNNINYLDMEFYNWLKQQFTDLDTAKTFYKKWREDEEQETPYGRFSMRAMAAHISNVLEGKEDDDAICTNYMITKYGSDIFCS